MTRRGVDIMSYGLYYVCRVCLLFIVNFVYRASHGFDYFCLMEN